MQPTLALLSADKAVHEILGVHSG